MMRTTRASQKIRNNARRHATRLAAVLASAAMAGGGCVFISGTIDPLSRRPKPLSEHVVSGKGDAKLVLIDLSGVITSEEEEGALGVRIQESRIARLEAELKLAGEDDDVEALILRVNSPGGSVTASDIVYKRLMRFKDEHDVPIVAQLMDVATSGGYYAALASDEIVAHPTTVTGGIGVVFASISLEGLLEKIGVRDQTVKTGEKKDLGTPLRRMSSEERELLETILAEMQDRFMALVEERRPGLTSETKARIADGRVLSAEQALEGKLVDRIGYLEDSVELAKSRAGLREAKVVVYRRPDEFAENIYSSSRLVPPRASRIELDLGPVRRTPRFLYLWTP